MTDFIAVEVVPSPGEVDLGFFEQLRLSVATVLKPKWTQFCQGFDKHPLTSIFLASLGSLAFFPIVTACTLSLFSIVFIACAAVFAGFFLIVLFQLAIVISLVLSLICLTVLASGVTASLAFTVVAGQRATVSIARLRAKRHDFDWPAVLHKTSEFFTALTPQVVLDEVSNVSAFLVSIPSRDLTTTVSESLRAIQGQLPFLVFPPTLRPTTTSQSDSPDVRGSGNPPTSSSYLATSSTHRVIARSTVFVKRIPPFLASAVESIKPLLLLVMRYVVNAILELQKIMLSRGTTSRPSNNESQQKDMETFLEEDTHSISTAIDTRKGKEVESRGRETRR